MGKPAKKRQLANNEASAVLRNIRISPQKLNLVAQAIRGQDAEAALSTLTFSRRRISGAVKKKLGLTVVSEKTKGGERIYRITDAA